MIGLVLTVISSWRYISSGHQTRQGRERLTHPNPGLCLYLLMVTLLTGVLSCLAVSIKGYLLPPSHPSCPTFPLPIILPVLPSLSSCLTFILSFPSCLSALSSWRYISSGHQTRQGRERLTHPNPGLCLYLLMVTLLTGVLSCLAVTHDRNPINQDTRPLLMAAYLLRAHGQDTHKDTNLMTPDHDTLLRDIFLPGISSS